MSSGIASPALPTPPRCLRVDGALVLDPASGNAASFETLASIDGLIVGPVELAGALDGGAELNVIDGRGKLLVPGFVNAHTHSPLNILKGTGDTLSHPAFMWLNQADTAGRAPDEVRLSALLGCIEHLLSGTTSVIDHFPEQGFTLADVDAVADAYATSGMRAQIALRMFDEAYDDIVPQSGLPAELIDDNPLTPPPLGETLAVVEAAIRKHHRSANGRVTLAPGPSNPMRCSDELLTAARSLAEKYDTAIHVHLLETKIQASIAERRYGTTMVRHLDRLGMLSPRLSCAHTIWISDEDVALMAERGAIVVHNPESNCKIGAGIAPVARMLDSGLTVALGTDGASTNDNLDMHETMRFAALLQRPHVADRKLWPSARDVMRMATTAGGRALQCKGLGSLAPGAPADFVLHDLSAPAWTPMNDPINQIVFTATGATVDTVVVAGRVLVRGRAIVGFDPAPVLEEARGMVRRLRSRNIVLHGLASRLAGDV